MLRVTLLVFFVLITSCSSNPLKVRLNQEAGTPIGSKNKTAATGAKVIVGAHDHMCAILNNQTVTCWGGNDDGQIDLKNATNASTKVFDVSNAKFLKITTADFHTCGILDEDGFKGIPVCFGRDGAWLHVPHKKVKDIAVGWNSTCIINMNDHIECVGAEIPIYSKENSSRKKINASDLPKNGIHPQTKKEKQDFSSMKFLGLSYGDIRLCARNIVDKLVYCMGDNLRGGGEALSIKTMDYVAGRMGVAYFLSAKGKLIMPSSKTGFRDITNISDPHNIKYKKLIPLFAGGTALISAANNKYDDGTNMPENTLITFGGFSMEGVKDYTTAQTSSKIERVQVYCVIHTDNKVSCNPLYASKTNPQSELQRPILTAIPKEIAR